MLLLVIAVVGSGIMAERLTEDVALALLCNALATGAALIVLWDGAPYHRANAVRAAAAALDIALVPLPGYSPDLMPVEALWRWRTGRRLVENRPPEPLVPEGEGGVSR